MFALVLTLLIVACRRGDEVTGPPVGVPSPTSTATPSQQAGRSPQESGDLPLTIAIDAPSRFKDFADIDPLGSVIGFDPDVMAHLAAAAGFEYEFMVTSFSGLLESVANGDFDIAMSALLRPSQPPAGLNYSEPYLEVGQVMLVRANETTLNRVQDITPGRPVGVQRFTSAEQVALDIATLSPDDLRLYETTTAAVQALIDHELDLVILDSDDATYFATNYPQQLKIAGGMGRESWIAGKAYSLAVAADNQRLLDRLNEAIASAHADGTIERLVQTWLVATAPIDPGESLVGTPVDELVVGVIGEFAGLDPAQPPNLVSWEIMLNTMSGLLMVDAGNNLVPLLAADFPVLSEDKLEYTFALRDDLTFPDGSKLTAEDVQFSILRAAGSGQFQVNAYLKDEDDDGFADGDAIQVIDPLRVKIVLQEPTSFFLSLVATPPYFVVNRDCHISSAEPAATCGAIGAYNVAEWTAGQKLKLQANRLWPGSTPAFEKILIRFYQESQQMRNSLENSAIDIAWTGLGEEDVNQLRGRPEFSYWQSAPAFKSYLVLNHGDEPWDDRRARLAIAYAVDRQALAETVFQGRRQPLLGPVPSGTPGSLPAEPARDLELARSLLTAAGFSSSRKLEMILWYLNDGRYTNLENEYAALLKSQLEETGLIEVSLQNAPWEQFRPQSQACNYPAFLLGWPSKDQPADFLDAMSWMEYFITNTDSVCSNYESPAMDALLQAAREEINDAERLEIYGQMQALWADEVPTLDLTQAPREAMSLTAVSGFVVDGTGLLHYGELTKTGG